MRTVEEIDNEIALLEKELSAEKTTSDSLKIVINSSFGKFGNRYSSMYDPQLFLQTTITGQLALMMLAEMYEEEGFEVISANTDGVMVKVEDLLWRRKVAQDIAREWERRTGMFLEDEEYVSIFKESVNSYFGVGADGKIKGKGTYAKPSLQKNPRMTICAEAVIDYIIEGKKIEDTIRNNKDISKMVVLRTVNGGALYKGKNVGKSIRWYYKKGEKDIITYVTNGNKVPNSEGARLVNQLPTEYPTDIDEDYYINKCYSMISDFGYSVL